MICFMSVSRTGVWVPWRQGWAWLFPAVSPALPVQGGARSRCSERVCWINWGQAVPECGLPPRALGSLRRVSIRGVSRLICAVEIPGSLSNLDPENPHSSPSDLSYQTPLFPSPPPGSLPELQAGSGACSGLPQPTTFPHPSLVYLGGGSVSSRDLWDLHKFYPRLSGTTPEQVHWLDLSPLSSPQISLHSFPPPAPP